MGRGFGYLRRAALVKGVKQRVIDNAIQAHGGTGVSSDLHRAADWATLRLAYGPDEVHERAIAHAEIGRCEGAGR
jgi:acyl-CoA dehydrogenase